ncbi:MAG: hypothetical protein KA821_16800 [Chitinophagaceae bacterium]|nr:hypothetical protein [Chitinophagaceae bacterium]
MQWDNKKKKVAVVLAILILLPALLLLIHFRWQQRILINASVYEVGPQLTQPANLIKWYPGADSSIFPDYIQLHNGRQLLVKPLHAAAVELTDKNEQTASVWLAQSAGQGFETTVTRSRRVSLWTWLKETLAKPADSESLALLKMQLEDPARHYGFPLHIIPVQDTLILTASATVPGGQDSTAVTYLHAQLAGYLKETGTSAGNYHFISRHNRPGDSVLVAVGLPVKKENKTVSGISWLRLPGNGRLLSGNCQIDQLPALYKAMNQYCIDKGLKRVALPLEKYTATDQSVTLLFPVY